MREMFKLMFADLIRFLSSLIPANEYTYRCEASQHLFTARAQVESFSENEQKVDVYIKCLYCGEIFTDLKDMWKEWL